MQPNIYMIDTSGFCIIIPLLIYFISVSFYFVLQKLPVLLIIPHVHFICQSNIEVLYKKTCSYKFRNIHRCFAANIAKYLGTTIAASRIQGLIGALLHISCNEKTEFKLRSFSLKILRLMVP